MKLKQRFNRAFPYYRLCIKPWCLRFQVWQSGCRKHFEGR